MATFGGSLRQLEDMLLSSDAPLAWLAARELKLDEEPRYFQSMIQDYRIQRLLDEISTWPGTVINSHKSSSQLFHKLVFVAELGLNPSNAPLGPVVQRILDSMDNHGMPRLALSSSNQSGWALCDAPLILHGLASFEIHDHRLPLAMDYLAGIAESWGMPCKVSESLGTWRGPGKKTEPCPFATLACLKVFLHAPQRYEKEIRIASECLLGLWDASRESHPFMFYMGTDFRKLKAPMFWYDILHVLNVLSQIPWLATDTRYSNMRDIVLEKEYQGGFIPESIYLPWKDWDFGQKKTPSDYLTFYIRRIERRTITAL